MAESTFTLTYDGPALRSHEMPVRELAPALLALGDLFVEASSTLYPKRDPVGLNIRSTDDGSFLVHLALNAPESWGQLLDLLGGQTVNALANLEQLILGSKGLFRYIKLRRNREITLTEPAAEPGVVKVSFRDGTNLEVQSSALKMGEKLSIRRATQDIVSPLSYEGIEIVKFEAVQPELPPLIIERGDLLSFDFPAPPDIEDVPAISHRRAWPK